MLSTALLAVLVLGIAQPAPAARAPDAATALCQAGVQPSTPTNIRQCAQFMRTHPKFMMRILQRMGDEHGNST